MGADEPIDRVRDPETYAIIGAAMAVHAELGHGFLERVYHEALAIEFGVRGIEFRQEVPVPVRYKNHVLEAAYRADFICYDAVIVEIKALSELVDAHMEQALHYLKATGRQRAVLLNFGERHLKYRRVVFNYR